MRAELFAIAALLAVGFGVALPILPSSWLDEWARQPLIPIAGSIVFLMLVGETIEDFRARPRRKPIFKATPAQLIAARLWCMSAFAIVVTYVIIMPHGRAATLWHVQLLAGLLIVAASSYAFVQWTFGADSVWPSSVLGFLESPGRAMFSIIARRRRRKSPGHNSDQTRRD